MSEIKKNTIGLIDIDGHNFPNIALMKLSTWHKKQGDEVEWYNIFNSYDRVYMSKVFSFTPDYGYVVNNAREVIRGGTGYAIHGAGGEHYCYEKDKPLPEEIEHMYPDYGLYGITETAYGFLTRGCPRGCGFCIVAKKEGRCSKKVANLSEFWRGQKNIVLCDPNILACKEWKDLFMQLEESKANIDLNQGLDARMLTEEKCKAISRLKIKEIHFAWDRYEDKHIVLPKLEMFFNICRKKNLTHHAIVYVLVNHGTTIEQDLERIYTLRDLGYWAYVMIYDKANCNKIYIDMQRWCNNRFIFAVCPRFNDYGKVSKVNDEKQAKLL